jgi:hypothetical protein
VQPALRVFAKLEEDDPRKVQSMSVFVPLMTAMSQQGDFDGIRLLMDEMVTNTQLKPDGMCYSRLVHALMAAEPPRFDEAMGVLNDEMPAAGVRPDAAPWTALVTKLAQGGRCNHALFCFVLLISLSAVNHVRF